MSNDEANRQPWVDTLKGIGIMCVVAGHLWPRSSPYVHLFHMPLFFLVSGWVSREWKFLPLVRSRAFRLLVPYCSYLVLFTVIQVLDQIRRVSTPSSAGIGALLLSSGRTALSGGRALQGWFDVFWFVPVLFGAQVMVWAISVRKPRTNGLITVTTLVVLYTLSLLAGHFLRPLQPPLALDVVPMAGFFILVGRVAQTGKPWGNSWLLGGVLLAVVCLGFVGFDVHSLAIDMKWGTYGTVVLSPALAIAVTIILGFLCRWICRMALIGTVFQGIGSASLTIMFLHRFVEDQVLVRFSCPDVPWMRIPVVILACWAIHNALGRNHVSRKMLLGIRDREEAQKCRIAEVKPVLEI